jgi:hypothetical protein
MRAKPAKPAKASQRGLETVAMRAGLAKLHDWPVKFSTTIHGREKKKKRPGGRFQNSKTLSRLRA